MSSFRVNVTPMRDWWTEEGDRKWHPLAIIHEFLGSCIDSCIAPHMNKQWGMLSESWRRGNWFDAEIRYPMHRVKRGSFSLKN